MLKIKPSVTSRESPSTNLLDPLLTWSMKILAKCYLSKIGPSLARKVSSMIPSLANRREKLFSQANFSFMTMNMRKTSQAQVTNKVPGPLLLTSVIIKRSTMPLHRKVLCHCKEDILESQSLVTSIFQRQQSTILKRPNKRYITQIYIENTNNLVKQEGLLTL
jgi:hypothetical protein